MEKAEVRRAAVAAVGWDADVGWRSEDAFPEVEVEGKTVEVAARRSGVRAWVGGATGAVLVLGGGGPVQEVSGGSVAVEVCRSGVSVEESVALRGGAVGWTELNSESTRREESKIQRVKKGQPPPKPAADRLYDRTAPDASTQKTANFWSSRVAHGTTPVLPLPHLVSAVSRGMTATRSAVQPNLRGDHALTLHQAEHQNQDNQQTLRLGSILKAVILELPPERTPRCHQNAPLLVLLNDTGDVCFWPTCTSPARAAALAPPGLCWQW